MTLPSRLGPFEIERELGAGAMGVVYLARDARLDRRVALKALPEAFADDADRLARFEREARMLAALHHPHVASLFGLEELDGRRYLVMEYVEGEDLAARISRGAVDVEEALKLADQIARGLAAAHDAGIIHRDLKPGNVLVTPSGGAKVVDFGLAKDVTSAAPVGSGLFSDMDPPEPDAAPRSTPDTTDDEEPTRVVRSDDLSIEPTVMVDSDTVDSDAAGGSGDPLATEPGAILGTAAYMSPEQARGRPLDRRTDVWSFGCVVFEMLARRRPFPGTNLTETILAVLQKEPDWDLLPERTPAPLRRLLKRCLRKDPDERLRDLGDASLVLREIRSGEWPIETDAPPRRHPALVGLAAAALLGALLALGAWSVLRPDPAPPEVRFTLPTPELDWGGTLVNNLAVAPDGRSWVYRDESTGSLFLRRLDDEAAEEIPHTEGAVHPFWSPDGRYLGFVDGLAIRRLEPFTGSPRTLVELPEGTYAGTPSWGPDGILYAVFHGGLHRIPAEGGESREILAPGEPPGFNFLAWPEHVGDGGSFLLLGGAHGHPRLLLFPSVDDDPVRLLDGSGSRTLWVPPDRLVFAGAEGLLGQRLDLSARALVGDPVLIHRDVVWENRPGAAAFAAAPGLLVSVHREYRARLQWFDATSGADLGTLGEPGDLSRPRISPSGRHVAVSLAERQWGAEDVWIFDLERDVGSRLTRSQGAEGFATWSPDGEHVAYFSDVAGPPDLRTHRADGGGEERILLGGEVSPFPEDWSPDGSTILYRLYPQHDLHFFSVESSESEPWLTAPGNQIEGRFSPDGRWIAFVSDDLGPSEVFVAPRSDAGARRRVSTEGGQAPMWAPDGEQIYFHDGRRILVAGFHSASGRVEGRPRTVLQLEPPDRIEFFDVAPDGERLLLAIVDEELLRPTTTVQVGWESALPD